MLRPSDVCILQLSRVKRVQIYGPPASRPRAALCAFNVEGIHATDISMFLDQDGKHAAPAMNFIGDYYMLTYMHASMVVFFNAFACTDQAHNETCVN